MVSINDVHLVLAVRCILYIALIFLNNLSKVLHSIQKSYMDLFLYHCVKCLKASGSFFIQYYRHFDEWAFWLPYKFILCGSNLKKKVGSEVKHRFLNVLLK